MNGGLNPEEMRAWNEWVRHIREDTVQKMSDSAAVIQIVPDSPESVDVKFAVELGLSIMLEKPIILVVRPDTVIPEKLKAIADRIVETDIDTHLDEARSKLSEAIDDLMEDS